MTFSLFVGTVFCVCSGGSGVAEKLEGDVQLEAEWNGNSPASDSRRPSSSRSSYNSFSFHPTVRYLTPHESMTLPSCCHYFSISILYSG